MNTKSNRSSMKSQSLIALFISAQYSNSVSICHEEMQSAYFQVYCTPITHIYMLLYVSENSTNGLKCPLALVCHSFSPAPQFNVNFYDILSELWKHRAGKGSINILSFTCETFDMCINVDLCTNAIYSEIVSYMGHVQLYEFKQTFMHFLNLGLNLFLIFKLICIMSGI